MCDVRRDWSAVIKYEPRVSILGILLFHVFVSDISFLDREYHIYSYPDESLISYSSGKIDCIRTFLTNNIIVLMNRFKQNFWRLVWTKLKSTAISSHGCDVDH